MTPFFLVYDATSLGYKFRRQFVALELGEQVSQWGSVICQKKGFPEHTAVRTSHWHTVVDGMQGINSDQNELFAAGLQIRMKSYCLNIHDRLPTLRTKGLRIVIKNLKYEWIIWYKQTNEERVPWWFLCKHSYITLGYLKSLASRFAI